MTDANIARVLSHSATGLERLGDAACAQAAATRNDMRQLAKEMREDYVTHDSLKGKQGKILVSLIIAILITTDF